MKWIDIDRFQSDTEFLLCIQMIEKKSKSKLIIQILVQFLRSFFNINIYYLIPNESS